MKQKEDLPLLQLDFIIEEVPTDYEEEDEDEEDDWFEDEEE